MLSLQTRIKNEADFKKIPRYVIEKDYALSYILAGIAEQPELNNSLIFKGGTALKKMYFGNYRFSEDLDFSSLNAPKKKDLKKALDEAIDTSKKLLAEYGSFDIELKHNPERAPHPNEQEAFIALVKFPGQHASPCRIKIEITHDEPIILAPTYKTILHGYEEPLDFTIACYHIEEIIAEKMRALLQTHHKLKTRGWNRPRARDYYDLWRILRNYGTDINKSRLLEALDKKCKHREVSYNGVDDFFTELLINQAKQHWQATLGNLMLNLPEYTIVIEESRSLILNLITS